MEILEKGSFASMEEAYFELWINEMMNNGYIQSVEYQPKSFLLIGKGTKNFIKQLKTKTKEEQFTFIRKMEYTPDWTIQFTPMFLDAFDSEIEDVYDKVWTNKEPMFILSDGIWYVDVKGGASKFDDGRYFRAMQKITLDLYKVYTQKIIIANKPEGFFSCTFTPTRFLFTDKTRVLKKKLANVKTLKDWVKSK